jgi:pyruvate-formate lyase-activating enzyme
MQAMNSLGEPLYHVTTLSNFARGFDKYTRHYRKSWIAESRYPRESYLLPAADLGIGVAKASRLRDKLNILGDGLLVLRANVTRSSVRPNLRNGVGLVWPSPDLPVSGVFQLGSNGQLGEKVGIEQVMAKSLALHSGSFIPYPSLRPRSVSFLPIARGCQAACPFCFSDASVSTDQTHGAVNLRQIEAWAALARSRGAERAVITGGGEPTLLSWRRIQEIVRTCKRHYEKVVLITNGVRLASLPESELAAQLRGLALAGLSVLSVSRHHHEEDVNAALMKLNTRTPTLLKTGAAVSEMIPQLTLRLICVLQRGGVESAADVNDYIQWAAGYGVREICFKELYVATSEESVYFSREANAWSARNQVPLDIVHDWACENGFEVCDRLPWGSPIFGGTTGGRPMRVAAYTEPSLFWERSRGLARSWNVMSDGTCLASLEDRGSDVTKLAVEAAHR